VHNTPSGSCLMAHGAWRTLYNPLVSVRAAYLKGWFESPRLAAEQPPCVSSRAVSPCHLARGEPDQNFVLISAVNMRGGR
jgi:hypothetical protein